MGIHDLHDWEVGCRLLEFELAFLFLHGISIRQRNHVSKHVHAE